MLNSYAAIKNKLGNLLAQINNVVTTDFAKERLQSLNQKLEGNIFTLVVVGQFKRGKTTFINTLLGADILPTAIIPLTSVITVIKYGPMVAASVLMNNGSKKEIPVEEIQYYATEKYNPKNEKGVARVEILYPSPYLKNGVQIVDTPGIASIHEHNTKTTYQYLPQADAAIFLVSVDPPITQAELLFLQDLKKLVPKIFFVQSKIDIVSAADRQEAMDFTKKVIEEQGGFENIEIYPLSAKTKSGLSVFEKSLEQFLLEEKGDVLLHSAAEKINNLINEELLLAELQMQSLHTPLNELESKLANFKVFLNEINQEYLDSSRLLTEEVKELQKEDLEGDLAVFKKETTEKLITQINELVAANAKTGNKKLIETLNEFLAGQIRKVFADWRIAEEIKLKKRLEQIMSRFTDRLNTIFQKIAASSSELFGIPPREIKIQETLPAEIEFRFQTEDESDMLSITLNVIKKMLPKSIAHKIIRKESQNRAEILVDRHAGKLRYDFSQRMEKLVRDYKTLCEGNLTATQQDILGALAAGLAAKQKTEVEIKEQETALTDRIAMLHKIKVEINNL